MLKVWFLLVVALAVGAVLYSGARSRCHEGALYTNFIHQHVFDRSVEAYESQNALLSLMKVYQAQASLELLAQVAGGDAALAKTCGDVHTYRSALYEQIEFYTSQINPG